MRQDPLALIQTRAWEFDPEEGLLDAARLARIVANPILPLAYKRERETDFRDVGGLGGGGSVAKCSAIVAFATARD
jgi:cobalamin biosynthesis protein CobT